MGEGGKVKFTQYFLCCPGSNKESYLQTSWKTWSTNEIESSHSEFLHVPYILCSILTFNFCYYSDQRSNDIISWLIFSTCHVLWLAFSMHYTIQKGNMYLFIFMCAVCMCVAMSATSQDGGQGTASRSFEFHPVHFLLPPCGFWESYWDL